MSDSDIIITAEDRLTPRTTADTVPLSTLSHPRRLARDKREDAPRDQRDDGKPRSRRRLAWPRVDFTPLQKLAAAGLGLLTVVVGASLVWHSGVLQRTARAVVESTSAGSARCGFRGDEVAGGGRDRTPMEQLAAALGTTHGSPILAIDIAEVKERLEALPTVRLAAVERRLPGAMHIAIVERQPVAIWQNGGEHVLVDKNGQVIPGPVAGHESLPLVVGDGAGRRADEVLALLDSEPALAARVKAAVLVSGRRWNVMLDDARAGLEVRLPEEGAEAAWHRMAELERGERLSERQVRMVDLRVADRTVLRAERAAAPADAARRKDNGD